MSYNCFVDFRGKKIVEKLNHSIECNILSGFCYVDKCYLVPNSLCRNSKQNAAFNIRLIEYVWVAIYYTTEPHQNVNKHAMEKRICDNCN